MARRLSIPALAAGLVGALVSVVLFSSTGQDDCHITFWSAWSLSELGEIVNHSGERVEQSSSLLHTLLLALLHRLTGVAIPWLAWGLGILAAVLAVLRLEPLARATGWRPTFCGLLAMATVPCFAYWQLGMLESSLFTLAGVEFLLRLVRLVEPGERSGSADRIGLVLAAGALASVRPEAGILAACVALAAFLISRAPAARGRGVRAHGALLALVVVLGWVALLMALRQAYFGSPFPQPVSAKAGDGLNPTQVATGLGYLADRLGAANGALLVVALLAGLATGWRDLRAGRVGALLPLLFVLGYLAFTVLSGGDWMLGWRFVAHVEPLIVFLLLAALARLEPRALLERWGDRAVVAANGAGLLAMAAVIGTGMPLWTAWQTDLAVRAFAPAEATWPERANQIHARDLLLVDELDDVLERIVREEGHVSVLSKQAGLLMYYAARRHHGKLTFYDHKGLVSRAFETYRDEFGVPSGQFGLALDLTDVLDLGRLRDDPALHPDVVVDIHPNRMALLHWSGYAVVYEQSGTIGGAYRSRNALREELELHRLETDRDAVRDEEALRETLRRRVPEARTLWRTRTFLGQFIAVRNELCEPAGLPRRRKLEAVLEDVPVASHDHLDWNRACVPYLRFLDGGPRPAPTELPVPLPRYEPFTAREVVAESGRQVLRLPSPGPGAGRSHLQEVRAAGRPLSDDDYRVTGTPADGERLVIEARARVRAGDAVEVRGFIERRPGGE